MCIAIYHDPGCPLSKDEFQNSWENNPDGGGFTYFNESGDLTIKKSMEMGKMYDEYEEAIENFGDSSPFAVHFRIATHGGVNIHNAHPFRADANTVVMHNGIIPVLMEKGDKRSDTRVFVEEYMSRLPKGWLDDEYLVDMVEEYIGSSKLIILTNDPKLKSFLYILNEEQGHWNEEKTKWYSNKSYCRAPGIVKYNLGGWSQPNMDGLTIPALPACNFCDDNAVMDDMCYSCEMCNRCALPDESCMCYARIHTTTDDQFYRTDRWTM